MPANPSRATRSACSRNEAAKAGSRVKPAGPELDRHLAADTNRILNLVLRYNRLGLYADSLELLNRSYPTVAPEDSEPGAPLPSADPLLAYYRGFCRDSRPVRSSRLRCRLPDAASLYLPSEPDEITVLHAALAVNASDASANFLLGTLFFFQGHRGSRP